MADPEGHFGYEDYLRYLHLSAGIIYLDEEINEMSMARISSEIAFLVPKVNLSTVSVKICSNGGDGYAALAIYDELVGLSTRCGMEVITEVRGIAASAAAMIVLQAGTRRIAHPHARFLIHEYRRWGDSEEETASRMRDELGEIETLTTIVVNILAKRCGKTKRAVKNFFNRKEKYMSAEQALKWGLIDEIVGQEKEQT